MIDKLDNTVINVSGTDLNDYFYNEISSVCLDMGGDIGTIIDIDIKNLFKQLPPIHITGDGKTAQNLFNDYSALIKIGKITNDEINNMSDMFHGCQSLEDVDLSELNTSKVTNMSGMFSNCYNLKNLDLSNFDTSNVTDMSSMFQNSESLTNVILSSFDTSKVTNMRNMFFNYFYERTALLKSLDLSNFNTSNVTDMSSMFNGRQGLMNLNISNFDFTNVTSYSNMFNKVPTDCYILVKDAIAKEWITSKFPDLTNVHYVGEE